MTRVTVKYTDIVKNDIERVLKPKFGSNIKKITYYPKKTKTVLITFFSNIFDDSELRIFDYIKSHYTLVKINVVSRSFKDIHNNTKSKEFQKNIKTIEGKIKPFYISHEEGKEWWVGIEDAKIKNFDLKGTIKEIYRIGLCCGLAPTSLL